MSETPTVVEGRKAFARREWKEAFAQLSVADRESALTPADLENLATAAYLVGEDSRADAVWIRAHHALIDQGNVERAAVLGFLLSFIFLLRGEIAQSTGWLARAERLLRDHPPDRVARGYGLIVTGLLALGKGNLEAAEADFERAASLAVQFGDSNLLAFALLGEGQVLIETNHIAEGATRLDEAMVAVTADEVAPMFAGIVYCGVILACQSIFDLRRAQEWTRAFNEWCASQPDLVPFRGQCLVHRSELLQSRGDWGSALHEAKRACEWLGDRSESVVGRAYYQLGELHRLRGEFERAEHMYREAAQYGREPQPGFALLRLAQGEVDSAVAAISGAVGPVGVERHPSGGLARTSLLCPFVEILLAAGDLDTARAAAEELAAASDAIGAPPLIAASAQATGLVLFADHKPEAALKFLRDAWTGWQQLGMPYESACARILIGRVCRHLGDRDTARLHIDAACSVFSQLGAWFDRREFEQLTTAESNAPGSALTEREREVLSLVALGETNREIASALSISEHTVARHVSNIFNKIGVTSRNAAGAFAHKHKLV